MKKFIFLVGLTLSPLMSFVVHSQQSYQLDTQSDTQQEQPLSEAELAQMLAPIALYPDSLLTHILISSTYPIEVIEAYRWVQKNDQLNATQLSQTIENFDWDASVKALVPFEQILNRLSDDLSWMQQLGNAFLDDETRVLASIQTLREQAEISGNLNKMNNMEVSYEDDNIIIEPVEKEVVYVPYYDTRVIYGAWHWSSFPPVYWGPTHNIHVNHHTPFYWHSGVRISFNYFFSSFHWNKSHVVVMNPRKSSRYRTRRAISSGGYAKRWVHQPVHRKGVVYRNKRVHQKYYGNKVKAHKTRTSSKYVQNKLKQRSAHSSHFSNKKRNAIKANQKQHSQGIAKSRSANVKSQKSKPSKVQKANRNIQNTKPKQRQNSTNKSNSKVRTAQHKDKSMSNRYAHNRSSKTHRGRDSKAKD